MANRRWYLIAFAALVAVSIGAVLYAAGTSPSKVVAPVDVSNLPVLAAAPAVEPVGGWLNSPPLTKADLTGKVVLYDFWTYSCINCVRTLPYIHAWYNAYKADGLVVIGVEAPEFDFEKVKSNVQAADAKLGVVWPVALDNDMNVWNAFGTQYWPTKDLADRQGRLRYQDFGEGDYAQTENAIRALLGVPASTPRAVVNGVPVATGAGNITQETYLGTDDGQEGVKTGAATYPVNSTPAPDMVALGGAWTGDTQEVTSGAAGAEVVLDYHAREVNLVLAPPGPPNGSSAVAGAVADLKVVLDGKPLPAAYRTPDTKVAADGSTYVHVTADDMYRLVLGPAIEHHVLTLTAEQPGLEAFDFTFGG